ncbi:MAG: membrane protein insertion efficiency factor YidD [Mycobacterium sp.]
MNDVTSRCAGWVRGPGATCARGLIFLIQLYRHMVSPLRPATCRFVPTCSHYAVDALTEYGLVRGSWLAVVRLAKCGPWHRGGWDPIPERRVVPADGWGTPAKRGESASVV